MVVSEMILAQSLSYEGSQSAVASAVATGHIDGSDLVINSQAPQLARIPARQLTPSTRPPFLDGGVRRLQDAQASAPKRILRRPQGQLTTEVLLHEASIVHRGGERPVGHSQGQDTVAIDYFEADVELSRRRNCPRQKKQGNSSVTTSAERSARAARSPLAPTSGSTYG